MSKTIITVKVDEELKRDAETLFSDLGLNMTNAVTMFLRQAVAEQAIPFKPAKAVDEAPISAANRILLDPSKLPEPVGWVFGAPSSRELYDFTPATTAILTPFTLQELVQKHPGSMYHGQTQLGDILPPTEPANHPESLTNPLNEQEP